jgi:hypothetical protein
VLLTSALLPVLALAQADAGVATPMPPELSTTAGWTHVSTDDGVRLETRAVKDSAYAE